MKAIWIYLLLVNGIGAAVTAWDKRAARRGAWRVAEKTLFLWCVLGGCPGVYLTMRCIHHKTRHKRFMWGIPLIFVLQCALVFLLWKRVITIL
ncbi:MAG: DUF1294 domain-containing protein [Eubacteriales bacterium]|nr:DUF1294 domain-containing protein [Eubacteriales bacterium]